MVGVEAVPLANAALLAGFGDEAPPRPLKSNFTVRTALSPEYDNITVVVLRVLDSPRDLDSLTLW